MRTLIAVIFVMACFCNVHAQETLGANHFASKSSNLLLFDLRLKSQITGSLHSISIAKTNMVFVEVPVDDSELTVSDIHLTSIIEPQDNLIIGYNRQPKTGTTTQIAKFSVKLGEQVTEFGDSFQFSPPSPGLFVIRNGLRTRIYYKSTAAREVSYENMQPIMLVPPDSVGFLLPDGFEGRTIGNSGQMFSPTPAITDPIVSFVVDPAVAKDYVIDFSRPEPAWFKDISDLILKLIAVFLPIPLLIYAKPEEVNERRYKIIASIVFLLIVIGYMGLGTYAYIENLGIQKIGENAIFAVATLIVTFLTYWMTKSSKG